ncbi:MAG: helix-turn-helix domain-containing protein [Dysgonomonas sp.]|nr:helix-turn-helix domain-containing protein [Dysgonomonas sp.]
MISIPKYNFHKTKYGEELLIDVVKIKDIAKYIEKHPTHILSYYDITFIQQGTGCFTLNDSKYDLKPGDVVFSTPGDIRSWNNKNTPDGYALIFEEEFLLSFFNDPLFLQNLSYFNIKRSTAKISIIQIQERINSLIDNIILEINNFQAKDKHLLRALLYEMLTLLNREFQKQNTTEETNQYTNRHINSFTHLLNTNFKDHHDTQYYADKLCISPNYLNEVTQKAFGTNAKSYILNKLITEAKKMLTFSDLSVSEISDSLNFSSSSYFIRLFRNHTNLTPAQYRNSINR